MEIETTDVVLLRLPPRLRAIAVIAGAALIQITFGFGSTFGNMIPYLVSYMRWKVDPTMGTGSVMWITMGVPFAYLIGGCFEQAIGIRLSVTIGCAIYSGSLALCYYTIGMGVGWMVLSVGIAGSLGIGIASNCVLVEVQRWMPGHLGLAGAITGSGITVGSFFLAPLQTFIINPDNLAPDTDGYFTQPEVLEQIPRMFLINAVLFAAIQCVAVFFMGQPKKINDNEFVDYEDANTLMEQPLFDELKITSVDLQPALTSPTFWAFSATFFLQSSSAIFVLSLYKAFGQTFIDDDFFLCTITSYMSVAACISQLIFGALAYSISYRTSMSVSSLVSALSIWSTVWIKEVRRSALYLIAQCIFAASAGILPAMVPYGMHQCFGAENFGIIYGAAHIGTSIGAITSSLITQLFLPVSGLSNMVILGGFCYFVMFVISCCLHRSQYGAPLAKAGGQRRRKIPKWRSSKQRSLPYGSNSDSGISNSNNT